MQKFIDGLMKDDTLNDNTKMVMLLEYENKWSTLMATTNQSKEELEDHLGSLDIIQRAIGKLRNSKC
jgi:hypothetical protein